MTDDKARSDPLIGQQIGNYTVRELIGQGGMGKVYLAEHPLISKQVAVKILEKCKITGDADVQRVTREIDILK